MKEQFLYVPHIQEVLTFIVHGENSPAISGQKGSWISINNCQLYTSKKGSPLLTTLGSLEIKNTNGSAKNSHAIITY